MIVIMGCILGAVYGGHTARKQGGNRLDIAQYAAVGGIIGGLLGLFVTIGIEKML